MLQFLLKDIPENGRKHVLERYLSGSEITDGGLSFKRPGERSHDIGCDCESCDGNGRHKHDDCHEIFIILQGKAEIEINDRRYVVCSGNVIICEPGEEHHLTADKNQPCVNIWLQARLVKH